VSLTKKFVGLRVRFGYYIDKIRVVGPGWAIRWMARRIAAELIWVVLLPITVIAHLAGYRKVPIKVDRIGHLAAEFDCFLKERALGHLPARKWFVLAPVAHSANASLLDYWKRHVPVIRNIWACAILDSMGRHGLMEFNVSQYLLAPSGTAKYYSVLAQWGTRPPLLTLDGKHRERGWDTLARMGIPRDAWFVAIHAREPGFSPHDENAHAHRNSDVRNLMPAIQQIRRRGGWIVRMGDPTMRPFPPTEGIVDYAHNPAKSDWMDVFLCASARFFVGNSSGLFIVATAFGVPCALANMVATSHLAFSPADISIFKLIRSERQHRYLTFDEIFSLPVANYGFAQLFDENGYTVEENTPEDLCDLVVEMLDCVEGSYRETEEDITQQSRFKSLLQPGHYGYGAAGRIGSAFLRRHAALLENKPGRSLDE
jgi:putative glycosyltransferase (TIGR04372 family)